MRIEDLVQNSAYQRVKGMMSLNLTASETHMLSLLSYTTVISMVVNYARFCAPQYDYELSCLLCKMDIYKPALKVNVGSTTYWRVTEDVVELISLDYKDFERIAILTGVPVRLLKTADVKTQAELLQEDLEELLLEIKAIYDTAYSDSHKITIISAIRDTVEYVKRRLI